MPNKRKKIEMIPCPWCGKYFVKKVGNQRYCSHRCGDEVNHHRAVFRHYGKKFDVCRKSELEILPIIQTHEYTSDLQKWRDER